MVDEAHENHQECIRQRIHQLQAEIDQLKVRAESAQSSYEVRETWVHIDELQDVIQNYQEQLDE